MRLNWNPPDFESASARIAYTADYALAIHQGATYRDTRRPNLPPSPWVLTTIDEADCPALFISNWDGDVKRTFESFIDHLSAKMQTNLASSRWYHPRDTTRKSGEFVPAGLRDRIDLGNLYDSLEITYG